MRAGFVTRTDSPGIDDDDQTVIAPLFAMGVEVDPVPWDDPAVPWGRYDLLVIRSTWDYHRRIDDFLAWVDRPDVARALWNRPATVRWNSHKTYLRDLEGRGVPVVPTVWGSRVGSVYDLAIARGWDRLVLKPAVSADGENTFLVETDDRRQLEATFRGLRDRGEVLIQPFLSEVTHAGERSLVFLGGEYSHAALRASRLAPAPALTTGTAVTPSPAELEAARRAVATLTEPTLYARVDLVTDSVGTPRVMELELIEPTLFLRSSPASAQRFAAAIGRIPVVTGRGDQARPGRSNA